MQSSNPHILETDYFTSLLREVDQFERFIMIRHTVEIADRGLIHDVGEDVANRYAIWGRLRPIKLYEQEKISGVFQKGMVAMDFAMPLGSQVPNKGDYIEAHGVQSRQPRQRYRVHTILPQSTVMIGRCIVEPIGEMRNDSEPGGGGSGDSS